ncbi:WD repeat-containing protein 55 [Gouania willdenowi]|uniref:WD repeat-containing protein 55 n=1 Tax=Gouania willdenowi TaxID=441366 RepID=A0A8C5DDE4_GOUWI|nr:WD repeat-containing protein 55 [Gouania willdenowi]
MAASTTHVGTESSETQDLDPEADSEEDEARFSVPELRDTPADILLEAPAMSVSLHPNRDLLACGDVDGDVYVFSYSCTEPNRELWSSGHHRKSCRQVRFTGDGLKLVTAGRDRAVHVLDAERGVLVTRIRAAHQTPINSLLLLDQNLWATGDEGGTLKVWDMRKGSAIMDLKHHQDYISDITVDHNKRILLTASGDGTMGVFNVRRRRYELQSEAQSGDLTAVEVMKRGKKVVCGSSEGTVYIFNWDGFGATSDRFALRAESVDCMVPLSDSIMCCGSTDGYIRAVSLLPNRVIGCVGQHVGEPIEELGLSCDARFLLSCAHDRLLKFWDVSALPSTTVNEYRKRKRKDGRMKSLSKKAHGDNNFFSGLVEEEETGKEEEQEESESESD